MLLLQGNCTAAPTGSIAATLRALNIDYQEPWIAPRCVLVIADPLFLIDRSRLWLDSVHIQMISGSLVLSRNRVVLLSRDWGHAYVTNTVVQSDRSSTAIGVEAYRNPGGVYCEGMLTSECPLYAECEDPTYIKCIDYRICGRLQRHHSYVYCTQPN